jgi:hypothetical protein
MRSLTTRTAGLLILAGGIWGGLIPFVGPYFHFTLGPTKSWTWTSGRLWLDVIPGIVAVIGGLMLLGAGPRPSGRLGALMAICAGIWFAIGPDISLLWNSVGAQGAAHGSRGVRMLEMLTYHTGLGAVMAMLGGYALPGLWRTVVAPAPAAAGTRAGVTPARTRADEPAAAGAGAGAVAAESSMPAAADTRVAERPAATAPAGTGTTAATPSTRTAEDGYAAEPAAAQPAGDAPGAVPAGTRGTVYTDAGHTTRHRRGGLRSLFARH